MITTKGLFLDLDGTVIETVSGDKFPKDINDWKFKDGILEVIKLFSDSHFRVCIVTNQGGIEKGFVRESDINVKLEKVAEGIEKVTKFKPFYRFSPHYTDNFSRKPNPGMAYSCALKLELSLTKSIMVGDMASDKSFAIFSGIGHYMDIAQFLEVDKNKFEKILEAIEQTVSNRFTLI
jgi:D-glycero-D-manno-heptose 1,7-bisphosphate phosphatase